MEAIDLSQRDLESLRSLPPTAELEENLRHLEERMAAGTTFVRWDRMFAEARDRIQRGRWRDQIQAERPEGCRCLGTARYLEKTNDERWYVAGYCSCPDGVAGQAEWEAEQAVRRARDAESFLERAGIPPLFEECSLASYPGKVPQAIAEYAAGEGEGLFIHGEYGTGKTGLAVAVLKAHILRTGRSGVFVTVPAVLDEIRATYDRASTESEASLVERVRDARFLVLDDLGAERPTEWVVEKLFTLINHRHDHLLPTVFTSNLSIPQLAVRLGERTTWRIVEMAKVVHLTGPNLRARK